MDAMQNERANEAVAVDERAVVDGGPDASPDVSPGGGAGEEGGAHEPARAEQASGAGAADPSETTADAADTPVSAPAATEPVETAETSEPAEPAEPSEPAEMPQPRSAEGDSPSGKGKKRKSAPKSKAAAASKSLVVFRDGKVHYADESVVVLDLDEAAHPETDVHDVVDKLSELRDAVESPGRAEAVALVAELIQAKALA